MAEAERRHDEARHDLVADAEKQRAVEHVVRERDGGGERDHVAREQRQLHAWPALGDAVAHRRHAARELGDRAGLAHRLLDQRRKALVGLMRREHVVVGRDDRDVGRRVHQRGLVILAAGGVAVREVAARQGAARRSLPRRASDVLEIGRTRASAALGQSLGDLDDPGVHGHHLEGRWLCRYAVAGVRTQRMSSCQVRPSRSISAIAADGPQVPVV